MAFANGSQTRIAYIAESAFGTTPATPTFQVLRGVSSSLRPNKNTVVSDEIRADRNVSDSSLTGVSVSGEIAGELSYGTWDVLLEAALWGAWSTNVLKNGVTPKSLTIEETHELGSTDMFSRFTGCMINTLQMSITARQIIMLRASIMGRANTLGSAIISGATYTAANTKPVQAAPSGVAALTLSDSGGSLSAKIRSVDFTINNNLRERPVVDSLYSEELGAGRCEISGTIEAYLQTQDILDAILAHDTGSLVVTVGTDANEKYTIEMGTIRFGDGNLSERNNNSDTMIQIPFQAVYDSGDAASIKITRAVA